MLRLIGISVVICGLLSVVYAQPKVDPRSTHERIMLVVPMIGAGTFEDPKRPMFAPLPSALSAKSVTGILGYTHVVSDDGKLALVEFVARDRSAFQTILASPTVKSFLKGRDSISDVETEFMKYKKDFDPKHFGVRMQ